MDFRLLGSLIRAMRFVEVRFGAVFLMIKIEWSCKREVYVLERLVSSEKKGTENPDS